jgi:predicted Zn-dependent peptidase
MIKKVILIYVFILGELMASSLPKYYTDKLDNGLEVVAIPLSNKSNVVTTDIFYKVGSRNEIMGKSGIAHMLEHLNFKSTENMKAGEFDEIVKSFGGLNNASTGFDYTHYYIKSSSKNMDKSLSLFSDMMENLKLLDEEFQPERDVVAEERRWRTDNNPIGYLYFRLFNNAFIYHSYHWTPIGFTKDIENWSIEDIKDFHSTYYQPKNAIIVVSGDIDKDEVFASAKKHFSHIKNTKELPKEYIKEPKQDGAKRVEIQKESQVEMVAIAYHIPDFKDKDQVALSAISEILSSGKSSWLQKELVDKKRLVNTIYGYNLELIDPGLFLFMAVCNDGVKAEDVEKEILAIIEKIKTQEVSQEELNKIKINTKADFIFSLESSSSVASLYGSYLARGDIKPLLEYEDNIENLTSQEIKDVANKYLNRTNSTTVILRK